MPISSTESPMPCRRRMPGLQLVGDVLADGDHQWYVFAAIFRRRIVPAVARIMDHRNRLHPVTPELAKIRAPDDVGDRRWIWRGQNFDGDATQAGGTIDPPGPDDLKRFQIVDRIGRADLPHDEQFAASHPPLQRLGDVADASFRAAKRHAGNDQVQMSAIEQFGLRQIQRTWPISNGPDCNRRRPLPRGLQHMPRSRSKKCNAMRHRIARRSLPSTAPLPEVAFLVALVELK
jgi:hypothetical protein